MSLWDCFLIAVLVTCIVVAMIMFAILGTLCSVAAWIIQHTLT